MGTRTGRHDQRLFEPLVAASKHTKTPWARIALTLASAAAVLVCGDIRAAHAGEGDIEGKIVVNPDKLGKPPTRNQGFIERLENPLRPIRSFRPWPNMVAVLVEGPIDDEAKKPPGGRVRYHLLGESFERPLLAVIAGTRVELVNKTSRVANLHTPDDDALADGYELNPNGMTDFKVSQPADAVVIRSQDNNHLEARIVAFPSRFFVMVDGRGRFEFKDVPEGNWKVKLWYRDGWLEGVEKTVEVEKRRTADVDLTITPDQVRNTN